jgi:hypothetical protein
VTGVTVRVDAVTSYGLGQSLALVLEGRIEANQLTPEE